MFALAPYVLFPPSSSFSTHSVQFQPFTYDRGPTPNYDMVLGMAFSMQHSFPSPSFAHSFLVRNVYTLFDYGDFINGSLNLLDPYIQMLSTTTRDQGQHFLVRCEASHISPCVSLAHSDF